MRKAKYASRQEVVGTCPVKSPFEAGTVRATAGIEFITFRMPFQRPTTVKLVRALQHAFDDGRLKVPRSKRKDWLTLHDPTPADIQSLIDIHPLGEMLGIEVRVDFSPRGATSTLWFDNIRRFIRHAASPYDHPLFKGAKRQRYDQVFGTMRDRLGGTALAGTLYIQNAAQRAFLRMYLKTLTADGASRRLMRVEIALNRGGCQQLQLFTLGAMPAFLKQLRRRVGSAFLVARGAKFNPRTTKSNDPVRKRLVASENDARRRTLQTGFTRWGATWCAHKGHHVAPDPSATRIIGGAFQRLSRAYRKVDAHPKKRKQIEQHIRGLSKALMIVSTD